MSKDEEYKEYGDKMNLQPEEDIEIKEEKEVEEIEISDGAENEIAYINTNTQSRDPSITIPVNISPTPRISIITPIRTQNNNWSTPTAAMGLLAIDRPPTLLSHKSQRAESVCSTSSKRGDRLN